MPYLSFLLRVFALCLLVGPASAQMGLPGMMGGGASEAEVRIDGPLSPEQANALISRLSDSEVRAILLDQLNLQNAQAAAQADTSDIFYHATRGALNSILFAVQRLPELASGQARAFGNFVEDHSDGGLRRFLLIFALVIGTGLAVEFLFRRVTARWSELDGPLEDDTLSLRATLSRLARRLVREVAAVLVFIGTAITVSSQIMPPEFRPYSALIGFNLIAVPRMSVALARFLVAPKYPAYRLVYATDATARAMVFHMLSFSLIIGLSTVILGFNTLNGVPLGEMRLGFWLNLVVHIYVGVVAWRYRAELVDMMRGGVAVTPMEERVAQAFPYFAIFLSVATWWIVNILVSYGAFELLQSAPHYKTLALLSFAPAMDTAIRALVRHLAPKMTGEGAIAAQAHDSATRSYIRIGRVVVFGLVLIIVARFWGMTPQTIAAAGVGVQFAARMIEFLIILSIGYLIYELVSLWINRKLAAEYTSSGYDPDNADFGGDGGGTGGSRLSTVLPLVLLVSRIAIVILFVLLALSNIGVDTTPLLAGAGIVGLAIGFGAQKLVTDVVSGIFFLVDDAFRTGEYVEIEGTMGTVEKISIRSMQLRHHKGPVHTIPYGEIPKITNFSRDWVIMKLRFTVPFGTDPNKVKKIFKQIGADLLAHEELGQDFLQPFKSQGVLEIDDVGMVIRGKFMAKPGKQFMIRKEIFNRVSAAFAESGIDFARREVRVALPGMDHRAMADLTEEDKAAIAAAASQAAQEQMVDKAAQDDQREGHRRGQAAGFVASRHRKTA